jgi:4-phytase/acid phosphatase
MHLSCVFACFLIPLAAAAQANPVSAPSDGSELCYVVYLSRHGVRSPTGKPIQYHPYSGRSMAGMACTTRISHASRFSPDGVVRCIRQKLASPRRTLFARRMLRRGKDHHLCGLRQRTREIGKAGAHGLMPGCNLAVQTLPEGTNDPVFHVPGSESSDRERARVAVAGRLGGDPANLTLTYREQLQTLDHILATCGIRRLPPYAA